MKGRPVASCFINAEDPDNCLFLTDETFVVRIKGKAYTYDLDTLKQLSWNEKKLLLPIISGGLISSLSVVAYYNNFLRGEILILLLLGGTLLLYYGITGTYALTVHLKNSQDNYLLFKHNVYLQNFTDFVNQFLILKKEPDYYLEMEDEEWDLSKEKGYVPINGRRELLIKDTPYEWRNKRLIKIDIRQLKKPVLYLPDSNKTLTPYVSENIPLSAVTPVG